MKTINLQIENLKCHGCANTIKRELRKFEDVNEIIINFDDSIVTVNYDSTEDKTEEFRKLLSRFGYPERGKKNFANTAKSYVSCAIGRIQKE